MMRHRLTSCMVVRMIALFTLDHLQGPSSAALAWTFTPLQSRTHGLSLSVSVLSRRSRPGWNAPITRPAASKTTGRARAAATARESQAVPGGIHEFDFLLHENPGTSSSSSLSAPAESGRRVVKLGGQHHEHQQTIVLVSSATGTATAEQHQQQAQEESTDIATARTEADAAYDPYADIDYQQQIGKIQTQEPTTSLQDRFKQMDLQDVIVTLIIPAIVSFAGLRWGFNKVANRVSDNADTLLNSFANEMIYHDGNLEEMRMAVAAYNRQLLWMGPRKGDAMIKRYLQAYAKKKTVTPQAIATLSYVFTLFKLSEPRAAETLVALCREMGTDKISSAGKILFFGSRILKSPEGKQGLEPIKEMIKSTYRDATVAETLVDTSQQAIGEAAYRATVQANGKNQKTLTMGWEVLGLDKETATRIFQEEAEEGFVSDREAMYGGQTQRYDKKGRRIDDKGQLENSEEAAEDDGDDADDGSSAGQGSPSNVYTCGQCGYTLFIAKGREFKFYGDDFKCPECGAKKDMFQPANIEE